jgi:hypothetical protein
LASDEFRPVPADCEGLPGCDISAEISYHFSSPPIVY